MIRNRPAGFFLATLSLLCVACSALAYEDTPMAGQAAHASEATAAVATESASVDAAGTGEVASAPIVDAPAEDQTVLRAQVLLDRAHFFPGEIDGRSGSNFTAALAGFQRSRELDDDGRLGPATWAELERDTVPTLVDYTVVAADVAGPFEQLPEDLVERSKLPALGYTSVDEALGERFHASPGLLASLNPGKSLGTAGAVIRVPNVLDAPAAEGFARVIVDKSDKVVMLVDGEDRVIVQFPSSTGSEHDPLPVGDWKVDSIAVNPTFHYNPELFWDADPTHSKATLPPGPNNPVGVAWIDLSKEHYGIHGTPEPSRVGKTESHGCIRLTNWNAELLSKVIEAGMPVVLRE